MIFDDVSNQDLQIINNVINGFFHMLKGVDIALTFTNPKDIVPFVAGDELKFSLATGFKPWISLSCDREFLENIFHNIKAILKNREFFKKWWAYDLSQPFNLHYKEIEVVIIVLGKTSRYFKYYEDEYSYDSFLEVIVDASFDEIQELKNKLEILLSEMSFDALSDNDLIIIQYITSELSFGLNGIDTQQLLGCDKVFLDNIFDKIIIIEKNRKFCKEWGAYNPQEPFSLDSIEMNVIIEILEKKDQYFKDEEFYKMFGCSDQEIQELKNRLESLLIQEKKFRDKQSF